MLQARLDAPVNRVNAPVLARRQGLSVVEKRTSESDDWVSLLGLSVRGETGSFAVAGTLLGERRPRLVRLGEHDVEVAPEGTLLVTRHDDQPGVIGALGNLLGGEGVNISRMQVGTALGRDEAMAVLCVDAPLSAALLKRVKGIHAIHEAWHVPA